MEKFKQILPGFISCLLIAVVAQFVGEFIPQLGSAFIAIILGIVLGNTLLDHPRLGVGVKFSESKLLEISIALTGVTLNLQDVMSIGWQGILFIMIQMTLTILFVYQLGKMLQFDKSFSLLMCAGNAVCGSSAIGTVAPIIEANEKDKGISITTVNLTGTVLMMVLPILTSWFYHHQTLATGAMIGGTLQSIGQVVAAGKLVNDDVTQMATIFKILRVVFLVAVAFAFSRMNLAEGQSLFEKNKQQKSMTKQAGVPWFIIVFFICSIFVTFIVLPTVIPHTAKAVSNQLEVIALAGIGMRVKFSDLIKEGPKSMLYGLLTGTGQVFLAVILIRLLLL
ncbi:YeiH family protein [Vagococcus elongatus]|uniref:Sulfate exporter family transporter n=1 Tax=Vagococcus elongatus TaxID=180344 RepID=A0A430B471_9ENTE|nr:putative sulfate exporter family transporter [Vagococcus elongatus]RSU15137.1 hypothetical protein CBF29_02050 [Vagococcus elongatus]